MSRPTPLTDAAVAQHQEVLTVLGEMQVREPAAIATELIALRRLHLASNPPGKVAVHLTPDAVRMLARYVDYQATRETNTWGYARWEAAATELRLATLHALAEINRADVSEVTFSEIVRTLDPDKGVTP